MSYHLPSLFFYLSIVVALETNVCASDRPIHLSIERLNRRGGCARDFQQTFRPTPSTERIVIVFHRFSELTLTDPRRRGSTTISTGPRCRAAASTIRRTTAFVLMPSTTLVNYVISTKTIGTGRTLVASPSFYRISYKTTRTNSVRKQGTLLTVTYGHILYSV